MTDQEKNFILKISNTREKWLGLHFIIDLLSCLLLVSMETSSFIAIKVLGLFDTPHADYTIRFFIVPVVMNLIVMAVEVIAFKSKLSMRKKAFVLSFSMLATAFICFAAHGIFKSLVFVFVFPILLAAIYGYLPLFYIMAVSSIALELFTEYFVFWNPLRENSLSSSVEMVHYFFAVLMQLLIILVCRASISFESQKIKNYKGSFMEKYELLEQMKTDELTGIYNRYALRMAFDDMLDEYKNPDFNGRYFFAMMDIDHFKVVNDRFGHEAGDRVLHRLGEVLDKHLPKKASFRYGGDEFCILVKCENIEEIAEKCRALLDDFHMTLEDEQGEFEVLISFGIAEYDPERTISQLVRAADDMLYRSKDSGGGISY